MFVLWTKLSSHVPSSQFQVHQDLAFGPLSSGFTEGWVAIKGHLRACVSPVWLILLRGVHRSLCRADTPVKYLQTIQLATRKIYQTCREAFQNSPQFPNWASYSGCALLDRHSEMARAPIQICSGMIYKRSGLGIYHILIISHQNQIGFFFVQKKLFCTKENVTYFFLTLTNSRGQCCDAQKLRHIG